ncbi:hypothetical protein V499_03613 [Pseudogymnoascus sp. VKM F-103]|uniref:Acyl-coenzyme A thioesterase THEM4 n=1 Tax=Pseudogymnoascus verrucosus TaxID=342668 RepID=A0A1B8GNH1_9PEZI|nr:uncharacterized protein VE01_04360 [Pseudogymnoascus verrucosus]KFY76835.1 hypothetical protein V499_03613 [Pseudogymnoascus sp. VKM F-103]OBT97391.1 hypothetical protein VE01_04360 [Pseudogymnoascus verrucosus]
MDYFKSIPWCAAILEKTGIVTFTPTCRLQEDANGYCPTQDQFFRKSLRNDDAIPNCVGFYQDPFSKTTSSPPSGSALRLLVNSSTLIFDLRPGINGFNGSAHGGLISALMDEAMGSMIFVNHEVYKDVEARKVTTPPNVMNLHGIAMFTASMNVRFQKPLATPHIVLVTATLNRIEGRKVFIDVTVKNENGVRFATCDGMWISVPKEKL